MKASQRSVLRAIGGSLFGAALLSACYTYRPIEMAELTPNLEVRTRLSGAEADRLSEFLGSDDRVIEGHIDELSGNTLLLLVPVVSSIERGGRGGSLNQRIEVARSGVVEVEVKELDRRRSGVAAGAITAIVGILVIRQLNQNQGGGDNPVPPPPPEDRRLGFPLFLKWGGS